MRTTIMLEDDIDAGLRLFREDRSLGYRETSSTINTLLREALQARGYVKRQQTTY